MITRIEIPPPLDDNVEPPETDSRGNLIPPKPIYEPDPPPSARPSTAELIENAKNVALQSVLEAVSLAEQGGDLETLFEERILTTIELMRDRPLVTSLTADPIGDAKVKEAYQRLRLLTRLNDALTERKRQRKDESRALKKEETKNWTSALSGPAVKYEKEDPDEEVTFWAKYEDFENLSAQLEMRARLNDEYSFGRYGGKVRIAHQTKARVEFLSPDDFRQIFAPYSFWRPGKPVKAAQDWLDWKYRAEYESVGFYPGSELPGFKPKVPYGHINLWRGLAIKPEKGDWSKLKAHILNAICQGDQKHFDWLMDWCAHLLQRPQEKPGTCVVLRGPEGAGKTLLYFVLSRMLGSSAHSVSQAKHVVGNFNSYLEWNILLGVEEALWAGDKAGEGVLKDLITAKTITIERKGMDAISASSYSRVLMLTNNDWAVPVGPNSRRYFVLDVKNVQAAQRSYFDPIYAEIENGGDRAMLDELLQRKIESNLRFAPVTKGLLSQREQSLSNLERWLLDVARTATVVERDGTCHSIAGKLVQANALWDAAKYKCGNDHGFYRALGPLLEAVGVSKSRPRVAGKQVPSYAFPDIKDLRASVSKHLGIPVVEEAVMVADDIADLQGAGATVVPIAERQRPERRSLH